MRAACAAAVLLSLTPAEPQPLQLAGNDPSCWRGYVYDYRKARVADDEMVVVVPVLSYKIGF